MFETHTYAYDYAKKEIIMRSKIGIILNRHQEKIFLEMLKIKRLTDFQFINLKQ